MEQGKRGSLRWKIVRQMINGESSLLSEETKRISRKNHRGFGLIPSQQVTNENQETSKSSEVLMRYTLHIGVSTDLIIIQRFGGVALHDFRIANTYNIDNTGLVCHWPSEEVLAYYCMQHAEMFRSKRVIELGSGYGLAGLAIAAATDATEVVISDGNPQVIEYAQRNIEANRGAFNSTVVTASLLHWDPNVALKNFGSFDFIVASDCTFFKEFHKALVYCIKSLLRKDKPAEALLFSPKRGSSLETFLTEVESAGLQFLLVENYDSEVWRRNQSFMDDCHASWPAYEQDHCYPLLVRIWR